MLIGFGAIDISDRLITPVSNQLPMPGVEINANVADMAAGRQDHSRRLAALAQFTLVLLDERGRALGGGSVSGRARTCWCLSACWLSFMLRLISCFADFHRLLSYGPLLVAGVLAAPIAQLENLLIVDREVTSRLQQLRHGHQSALWTT